MSWRRGASHFTIVMQPNQHIHGPRDSDDDDNDGEDGCGLGHREPSTLAVGLGWMEWISMLAQIIQGTLFQRLYARHLPARLHLPDLSAYTCIVTGATSGIGLETAK